MNSSPPAVATEPPILIDPVFITPRASSASTRPNGSRQAISPVLRLIAASSPHGGAWHGQPVMGFEKATLGPRDPVRTYAVPLSLGALLPPLVFCAGGAMCPITPSLRVLMK